MTIEYTPKGVCSRKFIIELEDGVIKNAEIIGGCKGNTQGICRLVKGMKADEVISRLENVDCGGKGTSCPDQLAQALKQAL